MNKRLWFYVALVILLIDVGVSSLQYYNTSIDPDLARIALPYSHYKKVLDDPTGLKTVSIGIPEAGTGRFFAHYTIFQYYRYVPLWLQNFTDAVNSIYLSNTIFMLLVQLLTLYLLALFATNEINPFKTKNLLCYVILTPLFVYSNENYNVIGLLSRAPAYIFFYLWPQLILFALYIPFFNYLFSENPKGFSLGEGGIMLVVFTYSIFSGNVITPVVMFWSFVIIVAMWYKHSGRLKNFFAPFFILAISIVFAVYGFFLSKYNAEFEFNEQFLSVADRYVKLIKGIVISLFYYYGYSVLLLLTLLNLYYIYKFDMSGYWNKYKWFLLSAVVFCGVYIILLPLGGYRPYRPYILRNDTLLPVTFLTIAIFIHSLYYLIRTVTFTARKNYFGFLIVIWLAYFFSDLKIKRDADCEKQALYKIMSSDQSIIELDTSCLILGEGPYIDAEQSRQASALLYRWNIMKEGQLILQKEN